MSVGGGAAGAPTGHFFRSAFGSVFHPTPNDIGLMIGARQLSASVRGSMEQMRDGAERDLVEQDD